MFQFKRKFSGALATDPFLVEDLNDPYENDLEITEGMGVVDEWPGWTGNGPTEKEYKANGALHGYGYIGNGTARFHVMEGHYLGGIGGFDGGFGEDGGILCGGGGNSVRSPFKAALNNSTKSGML